MAVPTYEILEAWRDGHGPIRHSEETVQHMQALAALDLVEPKQLCQLLAAATASTPRSCDEWGACVERYAVDRLGSPANLSATRN